MSKEDVTWRDALRIAQAEYRSGIENRRRVARAAHDAGLSYRQIAEGLGLSLDTTYRLVNRKDGRRRADIDAPMTARLHGRGLDGQR